jgi:hypothetical protein
MNDGRGTAAVQAEGRGGVLAPALSCGLPRRCYHETGSLSPVEFSLVNKNKWMRLCRPVRTFLALTSFFSLRLGL